MQAKLYQILSNHNKVFDKLDNIENLDLQDYDQTGTIDISQYGKMDDVYDILELIFIYGNNDSNFYRNNPNARSISVSDIIEINNRYYYCDVFGFTDVTDRINKKKNTEEDLTESVTIEESDVNKVKKGIINQLKDLDIEENQAEQIANNIWDIFNTKLELVTESIDEYTDKLSVEFFGRIFKQMKENGWDGNPKTADKYFDDIINKITHKDASDREIERESKSLTEDDNHIMESDEPIEDENDSKDIIDYIQDRIGQELSIGEFNTIMQSIFGKFNEIFLKTSEIYNQDPSESQEVTIWDDNDAYVISYKITDEVEPLIEITDVEMQ